MAFPFPKQTWIFFFSSINSFNQFSSLHVTFLLTLTCYRTMQLRRFPFQLSETSYKLKGSLPYQVSLSILGNKHNKDNRVSKKKKKVKKKGKRDKPEEKGKRSKHLEQLCFWKTFVQSPTEFPFLKVLFINVYNNSLEEKYKVSCQRRRGCLSRLAQIVGVGGQAGRGAALVMGCPHHPQISLLIISEEKFERLLPVSTRTLNIIRPTWRQISQHS